MAASILDATARAALARRVHALLPDAQPRWGSMTSAQAMAHLADALKMTLGELPVTARRRSPLRLTPIKKLIIHVAPMPRSARTAPELKGRAATDFAAEAASICAMLDRCADPAEPLAAEHPVFGRLSRHDWATLTYKHTDHHLRQFGA
jgi:hypothetical protein